MATTTRWEEVPNRGYGPKFAELIAAGTDVDGEARLADTLAPRGADILDAGSGMGRVAAALAARGHRVTAVEKDADLIAQSRRTFPNVEVIGCDLIDLDADVLRAADHPTAYDVVVAVGNVVVYLARDSEQTVLRNLGALLKLDGRLLVGFNPKHGPNGARDYSPDDFEADVSAAGLCVRHRFGTYELHPATEDYCVYVLQRNLAT